jgi:hypothetical protein
LNHPVSIRLAARMEANTFQSPLSKLLNLGTGFCLQDLISIALLKSLLQSEQNVKVKQRMQVNRMLKKQRLSLPMLSKKLLWLKFWFFHLQIKAKEGT